jgi:hypothetical protein
MEASMLIAALEGTGWRYEVTADDDAYRVRLRDLDTGIADSVAVVCRTAACAFACAEFAAALDRLAGARLAGEPTHEIWLEAMRVRARLNGLADALGEDAESLVPPGATPEAPRPARTLH